MRRLLAAVLLLLTMLCGCTAPRLETTETLGYMLLESGAWPAAAAELPEPAGEIGAVQEWDGVCSIQVSGLTETSFKAYLSALQDCGFSVIEDLSGTVDVVRGEDYPIVNLLLQKGETTLSISYGAKYGEMGLAIIKGGNEDQ